MVIHSVGEVTFWSFTKLSGRIKNEVNVSLVMLSSVKRGDNVFTIVGMPMQPAVPAAVVPNTNQIGGQSPTDAVTPLQKPPTVQVKYTFLL